MGGTSSSELTGRDSAIVEVKPSTEFADSLRNTAIERSIKSIENILAGQAQSGYLSHTESGWFAHEVMDHFRRLGIKVKRKKGFGWSGMTYSTQFKWGTIFAK